MNLLRDVEIVCATSLRIPKEEREESLFYYDVQHEDEDWFAPFAVFQYCWANHMGTIVTKEPLTLTDFGGSCLELTKEEQDIVLLAF